MIRSGRGPFRNISSGGTHIHHSVPGIILLIIGLWNATILPSEKGFYAFAFLLAIFGAVAVQKNTRDALQADKDGKDHPEK